jgi:hypothetical protein
MSCAKLPTSRPKGAFAPAPSSRRSPGDPAHLGAIAQDPAWQRVSPDMARRPWTDDFSDILQAILDKQRS